MVNSGFSVGVGFFHRVFDDLDLRHETRVGSGFDPAFVAGKAEVVSEQQLAIAVERRAHGLGGTVADGAFHWGDVVLSFIHSKNVMPQSAFSHLR